MKANIQTNTSYQWDLEWLEHWYLNLRHGAELRNLEKENPTDLLIDRIVLETVQEHNLDTDLDRKVVRVILFLEARVVVPLYRFFNSFFGHEYTQASVSVDHVDVWSMDHTLAWVVLPMLRELKKHKQGSPMTQDSDVPVCLHAGDFYNYGPNGETDEHFHDRWEWVLDQMISSFESKTQGMDTDDQKTQEQELDEITERWSTLTGQDLSYVDTACRKQEHGFALFGKYYNTLWT